jgi:hypothetical protein
VSLNVCVVAVLLHYYYTHTHKENNDVSVDVRAHPLAGTSTRPAACPLSENKY